MSALAALPVHLVDDVKEKLLRPGYAPPMLPAVALDVLRLSRTPHVTLEQIEEVLRCDPALAGRLLQQAQSPLFGTLQVTSLRDALVRLGLRRVGDLVMWTAINGTVFKGGHVPSGNTAPRPLLPRPSSQNTPQTLQTSRSCAGFFMMWAQWYF